MSLYYKPTVYFKATLDYIISSALCYCTAELLSSRGRPSVRRPSVDIVCSETVKWIDTKFY